MDDHKLQIILAARDVTKSAFLSATSRVKSFTKNIFSMRGAMVGIAGATGMGVFIKKSLESADAVGKAADVIGISTDALQEYRHAARLAGVSTELMDNSFKAFSKRVGEARNETGALVTFLKKFDEQLLKDIQTSRSTEEALDLVMDRMGRTASQTDRAALAAAAFSRSGLVLSNIVKDGAAGLVRMRQEARDLGIVMDEKLIRESERANDELEKLTRVLKVQFTSAAAGLAPDIAKIAQYTTDWWKANQNLVKTDIAGYVQKTKDSLISIKNFYDSFPDEVIGAAGYGIAGRVMFGSWGPAKVASGIYLINEGLKQFNSDIGSAIANWSEWETAVNNIMDVITGKRDWHTGALKEKRFPIPKTPGTYFGTIGPGTKGYEIYKPSQTLKPTPSPTPSATEVVTPGFNFDLINREMAEHSDLMKEVKAAQEEFQKAMVTSGGTGEIMAQQLRRGVGDSVKAFQDGYNVLENLSQRTAEAMEQNFSDFYFDVMKREFHDLGDYADAILDSIRRATSDVLGQATKDFLFGTGSGSGGGFISTAFGSIARSFGFEHGGVVKPFARGTVISRPTIFPMANGMGLMGEAGPEGVLPLSRTRSGDLGVKSTGGNGTGGNGHTYNVSIYAMDAASFKDVMYRNAQVVLGATNRALKKNPPARHLLKRMVS